MLPALLKAQTLQAAQDTAEAIARASARLDAIEAKQDEILAILKGDSRPNSRKDR